MRVFGQHRARFDAFERGQASRALDQEAGPLPPRSARAAWLEALDRMTPGQRAVVEERRAPLTGAGLSYRLAGALVLVRQRGREFTVFPDGQVVAGWPGEDQEAQAA